jgi:hypothetical protein
MGKGETVEKANSRRPGASSRAADGSQELDVDGEPEFRERRRLTEGEDGPAGGKEVFVGEAFSCQKRRSSAGGCGPGANGSG